MRWARSLFRRSPPVRVELTPDEQIALLHLCRFSETAADDLGRVIEVQRGATAEMAREALAGLLAKGMMVESIRVGNGLHAQARRYEATRLARKLCGRLPEQPRSTIEFIL